MMKQATAANRLLGHYAGLALAPLLFLLVTFAALAGTVMPGYAQTLSINDVSQSEGDSGITAFVFTISLSSPAGAGGVTFDIATADGTATEGVGSDYILNAAAGLLIPAGSLSTTFPVIVYADKTLEPDETFFVNISNVTGAAVADGQGQGTIVNDDAPVQITPASGTLTAGVIGAPYSDTSIHAQYGTGSYVFTSPDLPPGLHVNPGTGAIIGTPTTAGTFSSSVTVTDSGDIDIGYYTIVIAPLAMIPADGTILNGTQGTPFSTTFTTNAGSGGFAFFNLLPPPPGLTFNSVTHTLSGTPTAYGTYPFAITATSGSIGSITANYLVAIAPPTAGVTAISPASGPTAGGTTISITGTHLTGTSFVLVGGVPATGMTVVSDTLVTAVTPAGAAGPADVVVAALSGPVTLPAAFTYVAPAPRPDPTQDAEVRGLINAQAQSAERFVTTQIDNFSDRLRQLHDEQSRHAQALGIHVGVTPGASAEPMGYVAPADDPAGRAMGLPPAGSSAQQGAAPPVDALFGDTAFWSGGFINFGTTSRGTIDLDHTLVGVSGGVDRRFTPDFIAGIGFGYGRDKTDIGSNGTTSTGQALSAAIYGSYHPTPFFVDGLVGVSRLDFDSTRYVTTTGGFADGSRDGTQLFASLSAGYEYRQQGLTVSPYGRLDAAVTRLDGFTETGAGIYNLAFGRQTFSMLAGVVGLSAEYAIPMEWGTLSPRARLEYTHDFSGSSQASIGYADLGTLPYTLTLDDVMHDYLTVGLGIDATFDGDMTLSLDYRTAFGSDGDGQNHTFGVRLSGGF